MKNVSISVLQNNEQSLGTLINNVSTVVMLCSGGTLANELFFVLQFSSKMVSSRLGMLG